MGDSAILEPLSYLGTVIQREQDRMAAIRRSILGLAIELQANLDLLEIVKRDTDKVLKDEPLIAICGQLQSSAHREVFLSGLSVDRSFAALDATYETLRNQFKDTNKATLDFLESAKDATKELFAGLFTKEASEENDTNTDGSKSEKSRAELWTGMRRAATRVEVVQRLAALGRERPEALARIDLRDRLLRLFKLELELMQVIRQSFEGATQSLS